MPIGLDDPSPPAKLTDDAFLGGLLHILQPDDGYRAGIDAVLLAAAVPARAKSPLRLLDIGAGVGTVGLSVARRITAADVVLVERQPPLAALARENARRNGLAERTRVIEADILAPDRELTSLGLAHDSYDVVVANPPFHAEGRGTPAATPARASAHSMPETALGHWVRAMTRYAAPGGMAILIHKADALAALLTHFSGRFGAVTVLPIHPRNTSPAIRVIVSGRKGSRAPSALLPGLVLHDAGNTFTTVAHSILRDGAGLELEPALW